MAQIPVKPLFMKDAQFAATLDDGASNFEAGLSGVTFTPTSSSVTWGGLTPTSQHSEQTPPTWVCAVDYVQDWETEDSFSQFLYDNSGKTIPCSFTPKAGGKSVSANLSIVPGAIGGAGGAFATSSVSLGSDFPQFVAAPTEG